MRWQVSHVLSSGRVGRAIPSATRRAPLFHLPQSVDGPEMSLFSWLFSGGDKKDQEGSTSEASTAKGKGTRKDGTKYYQDVVHNKQNGFRVQVGEQGEERIVYPTADGSYVKKRKGR